MWSEGNQYIEFMHRVIPGRGMNAQDDRISGNVRVRGRSIPNLPTERLIRRINTSHALYHTADGLNSFDNTRRMLANEGVKIKMIRHELNLRGVDHPIGCRFCD